MTFLARHSFSHFSSLPFEKLPNANISGGDSPSWRSAARASHAGSLDTRLKGAAHGVFTISASVVTTGRRSVELLKRAFQISRTIKGKNQHPQELIETLQSVIDHAASEKRPDLYCWAMRLAYDYGIGDMQAHPEQVESAEESAEDWVVYGLKT